MANSSYGNVKHLRLIVYGREPSGRCRAALFSSPADVGVIRQAAKASGYDTLLVPASLVDTMTDPIRQGRIVGTTGTLSVPLARRGVWEVLDMYLGRREEQRQACR